MKVTNRTAYATIGCDVQLSENDRLALGVELDKVTLWLETVIGDKATTDNPYKAINNIVAFISKFAICPSKSNVFADSPENFERIDKVETVITDSVRAKFRQRSSTNNTQKEDFKKADKTATTEQSEDYFRIGITVVPEEQTKELRNAKEYDVKFIVAKAMEISAPHLSPVEIHNYILGNLAEENQISWNMKTEEDFKRAIEVLDKYNVKYKTNSIFVSKEAAEALKFKG